MTSGSNAAPGLSLSVAEVCDRLSRRLTWYGLPQLRTGLVMEAGEDTIVALLTDERDRRKVRLAFDRHTGQVAPSVAPLAHAAAPAGAPEAGSEPAVAAAVNF